MIQAVIFDWGGVISTGGTPDELSQSVAKKLGIEHDLAKQLMRVATSQLKRGFINERKFWKLLEKEHGKKIKEYERLITTSWDSFKPHPLMKELIKDLKAKGYKVAVLSNTYPGTAAVIRDAGGYSGFDAVVCSSDVGYAKPEPEIYRLVLEKLGLMGEKCLFIDDQQHNLDIAEKDFGMKTILATSPEQIIKDVDAQLEESP